MKFVVTAAALAMAATTATAAEFNAGGVTFMAGGEVDANYTTGVEDWAVEFTPYVGTEFMGVGLSVETTLDLMDLESGSSDLFTGLSFGSSYVITNSLSAYGEVDTDKDLEFGDIKAGLLFQF